MQAALPHGDIKVLHLILQVLEGDAQTFHLKCGHLSCSALALDYRQHLQDSLAPALNQCECCGSAPLTKHLKRLLSTPNNHLKIIHDLGKTICCNVKILHGHTGSSNRLSHLLGRINQTTEYLTQASTDGACSNTVVGKNHHRCSSFFNLGAGRSSNRTNIVHCRPDFIDRQLRTVDRIGKYIGNLGRVLGFNLEYPHRSGNQINRGTHVGQGTGSQC